MRSVASYKASPFHVFEDVVLIEANSRKSGPKVYAEVDVADFLRCKMDLYPFRTHPDGHVRTCENQRDIFIHQLILGFKEGFVCDHIDGNPLNNRRANLRFVTSQQNAFNRKRPSTNNSGVRGVQHSPHSADRPWRASLKVGGRHVLSRYYPTLEAASQARSQAEIEYFQDYRRAH